MSSSLWWCHQCRCSVRIERGERVVCPMCDDGFIEEMVDNPNPNHAVPLPFPFPHPHHHHHHYSPFIRWGGSRRHHRSRHAPPPPPSVVQMDMMEAMNAFVIGMDMDREASSRVALAHGLMDEEGGLEVVIDNNHPFHRRHRHRHHHHHHHMGDYALDHLIQQLAAGVSGSGGGGERCGPPPAARAAVEAMPTVKITQKHLTVESNCAVCMDPFEIGREVREMPCKHIYHADCILPWLAEHNSCPVCRHEMPTDDVEYDGGRRSPSAPGRIGLTIWGLPGGGFAVGRFSHNSRNSSSSSSSSSPSSSSSIFGRGGFVSDLGIRNSNRENHGRRSFLSSLWPFRSSSSQSSSSSSASSNGRDSRWWFM